MQVSTGEAQDIFWAPSANDLPLVEALLDTKWQTAFIMEVKTIDDNAMLTPVGVAFTCPPKLVPEDAVAVMVLELEVDAAVAGEGDGHSVGE